MKKVASPTPKMFTPISEALGNQAFEGTKSPDRKHQVRFRGLLVLMLVLCLAGTLVGCSLFRVTHEEACDAQFVLDVLERRNEGIVSFIGQGEFLFSSMTAEHRAKIFVAFLKPDCVMIKLYAPSGGPLMVFLVRNNTLTSYDFQHKRVFKEKLHDGVFRLDEDVKVPIPQFIAACTGNVEPIAFDRINCYRRVEDDRTNLIMRMGVLTEVVQYVRLLSAELRTESIQVRRDGQTELSVSFSYSEEGGARFMPETVLMEFPLRLASIRIHYKDARINVKLSPEHFRFVVPEYWRTEDVS